MEYRKNKQGMMRAIGRGRYFDRHFVVAISSFFHGFLVSLARVLLSVPPLSRVSFLVVLVNNAELFLQPSPTPL
jgi:hypothetical protein